MKKIIYISLLTLFFAGCDDHLAELNTDKKNPAEVAPATLFTQALKETFDMMASISVNDNPFNLYAQYWAQTTYPDESQYNMTSRNIPENFWEHGYLDALRDFHEAKILLREQLETNDPVVTGISNETLHNRIAAIHIMSGYVFSTLVDAFGNIPYTEALNPDNLNPSYDDARMIYDAVIDSLNAATASITATEPGFPEVQDPLYNGDMASWQRFANTLKLRLGMRLADVDKAASVTIVNEAIAAGVFSNNEEDPDDMVDDNPDDIAALPYYGEAPNTNPVYADLVLSGRFDFIAANTIVNVMNTLGDPRRQVYFAENLGEGVYEGGEYGTANSYAAFSHIGDLFHTPTLPGVLMNYAEVEFLLAEAVERGGYSVTGTAEAHYNAGIKASFDQWGVPGFDTYITQPDVAYATALGDTFREKIGIQLWLALYNQGFEGWTTWRRLDFGILNPPEGMTIEDIPLRFIYPLEEAQLNGENYRAAGDAIGGDTPSTPIFWDVN